MPADLRSIRTFEQLIRYLGDELDWPVEDYELDELAFDYDPADLGLKDEDAAAIKPPIRQLRPLPGGQPWGIFFVEFEKKRLPIVVLRRILRHLVVKKRASASKAARPAWQPENLLFICASGDGRHFTFAHFRGGQAGRSRLASFGWEAGSRAVRTLLEFNLPKLRWPDAPGDRDGWLRAWAAAFDVQPVSDEFFRLYKEVFGQSRPPSPGWWSPRACAFSPSGSSIGCSSSPSLKKKAGSSSAGAPTTSQRCGRRGKAARTSPATPSTRSG